MLMYDVYAVYKFKRILFAFVIVSDRFTISVRFVFTSSYFRTLNFVIFFNLHLLTNTSLFLLILDINIIY